MVLWLSQDRSLKGVTQVKPPREREKERERERERERGEREREERERERERDCPWGLINHIL